MKTKYRVTIKIEKFMSDPPSETLVSLVEKIQFLPEELVNRSQNGDWDVSGACRKEASKLEARNAIKRRIGIDIEEALNWK